MNDLERHINSDISIDKSDPVALPPILAEHYSPGVKRKVESFYTSIAAIFESWLGRRRSENTRRTYRRGVMDFIEFMEIPWPTPQPDGSLAGRDESWRLLQATVPNVQAWRDYMHDERGLAPLTLNHRVSSLSGFFKFLREAAGEMRLPIVVPNPAHSQFISRETQKPVNPTEPMSATRARQLMQLPQGEDALAYRDRAILKFMLYAAARIRTACLLVVSDFIDDEERPRIKIQEKGKGKSKRTIDINQIAADAIREYLKVAEIRRGPLFRARANPKTRELSDKAISVRALYNIIMGYLTHLPGAMVEDQLDDGSSVHRCIYTTHSLRATTATLLRQAGVDIREVQALLGHSSVTVTERYDHSLRGKDGASRKLVL